MLFPLFATGVVDTGGNLPPALLTPAANWPLVSLSLVANLPPVSTTQVELVAKFAAGVVDTFRSFLATGQSIFFEYPDSSYSLYLVPILLGKNLWVIVLNHFWLTAAYIEDHIKRKVMRRGVLSLYKLRRHLFLPVFLRLSPTLPTV
jgi:hypothetical protein